MKKSSERRFRKTFTRKRLEDDRLDEILDVAANVFLSEGFSKASTNTIAKLAHASKATFYSRFPSKEDLFLAVIEHRMERIFREVTPALGSDLPPAITLREFGSSVVRSVITQEQLAFIRLISMEAERFPRLAERFFELGPGAGQKILTTYMRQCMERGYFRQGNAERMAEHFMSLVTGGDIRWFTLGVRPKPGPKRLEDHLQAVLQTFLAAYGVDR